MNIFVFSSIYPSRYVSKGSTPVVHYFAKEWVKLGHDVHVFHTESCFPAIYYLMGRVLKNVLASRQGYVVPTQIPKEYSEDVDGVCITHLLLRKRKPHARFPKREITRVIKKISSQIETIGAPDCIVGHWDNPGLELLYLLKVKYSIPTCLVFHDNKFSRLAEFYGEEFFTMAGSLDLVGFRNLSAKRSYEKLVEKPVHSFIAASGVSLPFLEAGKGFGRSFDRINSFIYVGTLIERKYPSEVVAALSKSYGQEPFDITFIGDGDEKRHIERIYEELSCKGNLIFTGRIAREEVIRFLKQADVFVMISKREVFGLVYLEAMALGCITIASRNEGIDGIIVDGVNGFLCEAGNVDELATVLSRIKAMSPEALCEMSARAKETARQYSDINVANNYLNELKGIAIKQQ